MEIYRQKREGKTDSPKDTHTYIKLEITHSGKFYFEDLWKEVYGA